MTGRLTAAEMLDREFLEIRCRLIDIAAALDRIDFASDADEVRSDPRLAKLREAAAILTDGQPNRAQRAQMAFSDAYDPSWREAKNP